VPYYSSTVTKVFGKSHSLMGGWLVSRARFGVGIKLRSEVVKFTTPTVS